MTNHPKNDRPCAIRLPKGKVREDHHRRAAASAIAQSAAPCLDCIYFDERSGCKFGMEGKPDCVDHANEADTERARTSGRPPPGWRCPKCGALTDAFVCQECGAGWVLDA